MDDDDFRTKHPKTLKLSPEAWDKFIKVIENPPEPTPALIESVRKYGKFAKK